MSSHQDIQLERMLEALLFASKTPMTTHELSAKLPKGLDARNGINSLHARYKGRGVQLVQIGSAWAFRTAPDLSFLLQDHVVKIKKLSRAATETLSIIAYYQPVTRADIEQIRGVSVSKGTLDLLLEQAWIGFGKRKETVGRPVTFITTPEFLNYFGLASLKELPGLDDIRSMDLFDNQV